MVMGPTHAMSGAAVGLMLPGLVGADTSPAVTLTFAGVCAGAALLPDIDSPSATVSRSFGPATWLLSKAINKLCWLFYTATASPRDNDRDGGHRTFTHTALFAALIGVGTSMLTSWGGRVAVVSVLFFLSGLAVRGLMADWAKKQGWLGITAVAGGLALLATQTLPDTGQGWLGLAVGVGVLVHDLGDAITKNGAPLFAPFLPVRGKRWYEVALPGPLRIRAGGAIEYALLLPALTALTVLLAINTFPAGNQLLVTVIG